MTNEKVINKFICAAIVLFICGCAQTPPKPFSIGEVVNPPHGCIELRKVNPDGDC